MSERTYDVVLLVEQPLSVEDAAQVRSLHQDVEDPVRYHVLLPVEDAAARVEAAMGSLAAGEVMASPAMVMSEVDLDEVRKDCLERSERELAHTLSALRAAGATADGRVVHEPPVDGRCPVGRCIQEAISRPLESARQGLIRALALTNLAEIATRVAG